MTGPYKSDIKPSVPGRPGVSTIEKHPRRGEIEHDIAVGVPCRTVARKYDLSRDTVLRWSKKIPLQLKAKRYIGLLKATDTLEEVRAQESDNLLRNLAMQRARLLLCQDKAIELEDLMIARLSGQIHQNLELVGKYLGEFARVSVQTSINLLITPEYLKLGSALLHALWPFPEARQAVAAVLHDIEGAAAQANNGHDRAPVVIEAQPIEVRDG
jgi:hypothetical protein